MTPGTHLRRSLGIAFGVAVAVGSMIGAGILRSPADVATQLPVAGLFLVAWLVGGLYALLGANSLAELGTMIPQSGGQYVFVRRALGPYAGFLVGWNDWISTGASLAAIALVEAEAIGAVFPALAGQTLLVAAVTLVIVTVILWQGIRESDRTQRGTSLIKCVVLLALVAACLVARARGITSSGAGAMTPLVVPVGAALGIAFITALQGIIYAYDGWMGILYFSEEVQDSARQIPRSLLFGVISVIVLDLLLNIAFIAVLPMPALASSPLAAASAASVVFGPRGGTLVQLLVAVALPSAIVANALMGSRVGFALGRDRAAPAILSRVNAGGTPHASLLAGTAIAGLFLLTGAFERVIALCSFMFVAGYAMSFLSVFVLRYREPETARPYRAWGHPWTTGVVLAGSIVFLLGSIVADKRTALFALVLAAVSYPAYRLTVRRPA